MKIAFYKGRARFFNRAVSWWTRGPYSHCELVTGETGKGSICWSSSLQDGGVRRKVIDLDPKNWDIVDIDHCEKAIDWFIDHNGQGYDLMGLVSFVWRASSDSKRKWFCSEAVAAALGIPDPWRLDPNALHSVITYKSAS